MLIWYITIVLTCLLGYKITDVPKVSLAQNACGFNQAQQGCNTSLIQHRHAFKQVQQPREQKLYWLLHCTQRHWQKSHSTTLFAAFISRIYQILGPIGEMTSFCNFCMAIRERLRAVMFTWLKFEIPLETEHRTFGPAPCYHDFCTIWKYGFPRFRHVWRGYRIFQLSWEVLVSRTAGVGHVAGKWSKWPGQVEELNM